MNNKPFLLALNRMPNIGPRTVMKLLAHWPSLQDMFALSKQALVEAGLSQTLATTISTFEMKLVEKDLEWEKAENHHLLTWADSSYPSILKEIHDPPVAIYAEGDLNALLYPMLAMVGTRKPSSSGKDTARLFAHHLASAGLCIVSGLAQGIDAEAHAGCLTAGGRTIAVMGTGIDSIYPPGHRSLARQITEKGLLLTEFPLKCRASAGHFPRRNRIISGLSSATLVVEAAMKSGSLITARLALEQNRDVLAIPGSIHNPQARGCHHLLQQGAKLISSIQDVLDEVKSSPIASIAENISSDLCVTPINRQINNNLENYIDFEVTSIDKIMQRSGLTLEHMLASLAQLEIAGIVKAIPGGYSRCILAGSHKV